MAEQNYLNEATVYVTRSRLVVGTDSYPMVHITDFSTQTAPATPGCGYILVGMAVLVPFFAIPLLIELWRVLPMSGGGALFFALFTAFFIFIGWQAIFREQQTYQLVLGAAGDQRQVLSSKDRAFVDRVAAALTQVIADREQVVRMPQLRTSNHVIRHPAAPARQEVNLVYDRPLIIAPTTAMVRARSSCSSSS